MTEIIEIPPFNPDARIKKFDATCRRLRLKKSYVFNAFDFAKTFFDKQGFLDFLQTLEGPVVIEPDWDAWRCGVHERDWRKIYDHDARYPVLKVRQPMERFQDALRWLEEKGIQYWCDSAGKTRTFVFRSEQDMAMFRLSGCEMKIIGEPKPMTGLFANLTDAQKAAALSYAGEESHGDPSLLNAGSK